MAQRVRKKRRIRIGRTGVLMAVFCILSFILINRLYHLQIVEGENYRTNFTLQTTRTRTIKSTRGNIYDRNGVLLASSELSYALTIEDSGNYDSKRIRALSLNSEAYRIAKLLREHDTPISQTFHIVLDAHDNYVFDVSGVSLNRFRADVYGEAYIEDLTEQQATASANQMMTHMIGEDGFSIIRTEKPYTEEELAEYGLPSSYTKEELLDICRIRYALFTTSYQRYMPVTIAKDLNDELVALLTEQKDTLTGIEIVEDTKRVYRDPVYFAALLGYTGPASAEDLAELQQYSTEYTVNSIVGKSGLERVLETTLQGSDGEETLSVDNVGRILEIDEASRREPLAGNDVYLTVDHDLTIAVYKILEQRIAGILSSVIEDKDEVEEEVSDSLQIRIPRTKAYFALINNSVVDMHHFTKEDASEIEKEIAVKFAAKQKEVLADISHELTGSRPRIYSDLTEEMQEYQDYIVNDLLTDKMQILNSAKIDKTDEVYLAYTRDENISMQDYLTYAASQNWIDITYLAPEENYIDSTQIFSALSRYVEEYLAEDDAFSKLLYKYMIYEGALEGHDVLEACYDQGVLDKEDGLYDAFMYGDISSYELLMEKIGSLEITPAMLALDPCTGSAVITNPNTGEVLACVSYPGYDNNRLANTMDVAYYRKLSADLSEPFYNKATQARTAPGSTFKIITSIDGLMEGVIDQFTEYDCTGIFDLTETPLRCWDTTGHGKLAIHDAIKESCNVFFCSIAYNQGINEEGNWSDSLSLGKLQNYAELFDMDKPSGIEVPEASPRVSDQSAIQSSIGQGTHAYTTTQMARYATILANGGTSYKLSLIDRVTDSRGTVLQDYTPEVQSHLSVPQNYWDIIHSGMRAVIENNQDYADMPIAVAGKTGTAQESKSRPPHALFVCYAPYEQPEIAMAVRISNGYSSTYVSSMAKDILKYYFKVVPNEEIITGRANNQNFSSVQTD